ncbi:hypothetical protein C8E88_105315 [Fibrobacter sp. UWR1]|nr:hypothetical protein C8E88_105315 [Fibrobacter sp. UWR1]
MFYMHPSTAQDLHRHTDGSRHESLQEKHPCRFHIAFALGPAARMGADSRGACRLKIKGEELFPWPHELISIQMNHVIRRLGQPYFCFPCQHFGELFEGFKIKECCCIYFTSRHIFSHFFKFFNSFWIHWAYRCYCFDKVNPVFPLRVKNNIRHFVMQCNFKA